MLLLDVELAEERQNEILTRARELVEKDGGTWVGQESWGRRRLAYDIDKKPEAIYYLLHFDCEPATLDELTRILKITDGAMRHMAVRRLPTATRTPPPPPPAETEAVSQPIEDEADEPVAAAVEAAPEPEAAPEVEAEAEPAAEAESAAEAAPEPEPETAAEPEPAEAKE
jgi:small subunit ribosomal protein S6